MANIKNCIRTDKKTGEAFVEHKGEYISLKTKDVNKGAKEIEEAAKKKYKDLPEEEALARYLDDIVGSSKRKAAYNDFINQISRSNLDELIEHVFDGHLRSTLIGRRARSTRVPSTKGIHSEDLLDGIKNRVKPGSKRPSNPVNDEAYKAHVQMKGTDGGWVDKYNRSGNIIDTTMFPKNWNKQRILEEVAFAYKNKVQDLTSTVHFNGMSTNGIKIIFVVVNDIITTVYPKI